MPESATFQIQSVRSLLNSVAAISIKYDKIAEITGERFNVFGILGLETREVRTHSRFLTEILNPRGSHGLGDKPLKKFLEIVEITGFDSENASVICEHHIGGIDEEKNTGGRIDILIRAGKGQMIAIENKIYAQDQPNQLRRYYNYLEANKANRGLIYLTLTGEEPSALSNGSLLQGKYTRLAYRDAIVAWLAEVQQYATAKPLIRESIAQYINLIKKLTGQTENAKMAEEVASQIVSNEENLKAFYAIYNSRLEIFKLIAEKNRTAWEAIAAARGLDKPGIEIDGKRFSSIYFDNSLMRGKKIRIGFQFDGDMLSKLFYGICDNGKLPNETREVIFKEYTGHFQAGNLGASWPAWEYWANFQDGMKLALMLNTPREAENFNKALAEKLDELLAFVKKITDKI